MAHSMLEYTKIILNKVSFDYHLFRKELEKAIIHLLPHELEDLRLWIIELTRQKPELDSCLILIKSKNRLRQKS